MNKEEKAQIVKAITLLKGKDCRFDEVMNILHSLVGLVYSNTSFIPEKWIKLASEPVNSPSWHSSEGEEYFYQADGGWLVVNEKIGPYRVRQICQIVKEIKIEPEKDPVNALAPGEAGK